MNDGYEGDFSVAAARAAAAHWDHGPDADLHLLCISENATYLLRDARTGERSVLRLNRPGYHRREALESELSWTAALRRDGVVSTPAFILTSVGTAVATLAPGRHAVMFEFAEGASPPPGALAADMSAIGEIAARLHTHSRSWAPPVGFTRFEWDLSAALGTADGPGRWGDWRCGAPPDIRPVLTAAQRRLMCELTEYGVGRGRYGLIHADLRAANLLVGADQRGVTVVDFDDCGRSWYGYDLAASVSFLEHRPELSALVAGWVQGYRRGRRLDSEDIAVLPALIMLRRLQLLAWSASHADTEMARSLGGRFAADTADVAELYLRGRLLT